MPGNRVVAALERLSGLQPSLSLVRPADRFVHPPIALSPPALLVLAELERCLLVTLAESEGRLRPGDACRPDRREGEVLAETLLQGPERGALVKRLYSVGVDRASS